MKFKIGDKVRILPSAIDINVAEEEVGKVVEITEVYEGYSGYDYTVSAFSKRYGDWWMRERDIASALMVGQQLVFDFME